MPFKPPVFYDSDGLTFCRVPWETSSSSDKKKKEEGRARKVSSRHSDSGNQSEKAFSETSELESNDISYFTDRDHVLAEFGDFDQCLKRELPTFVVIRYHGVKLPDWESVTNLSELATAKEGVCSESPDGVAVYVWMELSDAKKLFGNVRTSIELGGGRRAVVVAKETAEYAVRVMSLVKKLREAAENGKTDGLVPELVRGGIVVHDTKSGNSSPPISFDDFPEQLGDLFPQQMNELVWFNNFCNFEKLPRNAYFYSLHH